MSAPDWTSLYAAHLEQVTATTQRVLAETDYAGIVFHAGKETLYHADDQHVDFRSVPHFARFGPFEGPEHLLLLPREGAPRLIRVVARDFWYEPPADPPEWVSSALKIETVGSPLEARERARELTAWAYVGNDPTTAKALRIGATAVEPKFLVRSLDWERAYKTPYEVACLREAASLASLGHKAVQEGVNAGKSEHALHLSYLEAAGILARQAPYETIIAWDRHAAVLHYPHKDRRPPDPGRTFLIDAGATVHGYASDITRTYLREGSHPVFHEAWLGMIGLQEALVAQVRPGLGYVDLHEAAFRGVTELLCVLGVLTVSADEAFTRRLAFPFFPHGLGHHLGLQVHDVGGKLTSPTREPVPAPEAFPWLRTTRPLEEHHVVTIEPGLYFIPLLLDGYRQGEESAAFNWPLIDELIPSGGIRIEDDVLVTAGGPDNLSRPFLPTG